MTIPRLGVARRRTFDSAFGLPMFAVARGGTGAEGWRDDDGVCWDAGNDTVDQERPTRVERNKSGAAILLFRESAQNGVLVQQ